MSGAALVLVASAPAQLSPHQDAPPPRWRFWTCQRLAAPAVCSRFVLALGLPRADAAHRITGGGEVLVAHLGIVACQRDAVCAGGMRF
jgi:hypothetical protein